MNTNTDNTMQDTQLDGMYRMASKFLGYTGPKTAKALEQFRSSSPAVAAKMKRYSNAMAKGGLMRKGYAEGGVTQSPEYQMAMRALAERNGSMYSTIDRAFNPPPPPTAQEPSIERAIGTVSPLALEAYQKAMGTYQAPAPKQQPTLNQQIAGRFGSAAGSLLDMLNKYFPEGGVQEDAMAKGGLMRKGYATGGIASGPDPFITNQPTLPKEPKLKDIPKDASDAKKKRIEEANKAKLDKYKQESMAALSKAQQNVVMGTMTPYRPEVDEISETAGQIIPGTAGQVTGAAPTAATAQTGGAALAGPAMMAPTAQTTTALAEPQVAATLAAVDAAQGQVSSDAQVAAATQATSSVSNLQAAQGTAIMMNNPVQRQIEAGELISGAANAATAAAFTEQVQAAEATPSKKATVAGQLEGLMQQFDNGQTPPWAAGAMRSAMQTLSARGLGASSMAGQAVIQAAMEASLPIAQADAATQAQFESQNLSNRQQRAMLAAQQRAEFLGQEFDQAFQARVANASRIADVANMNFTAEQQVALENSRLANTMQLENLNNRQAVVIAEASALANMDLSNLNNRQQAAVQNAQSFLQMDMANLSNEQQTNMFKAQQNLQALFTDQAAINAAAQFNASSENQTNQFFANLMAQTDQFNASQYNAMSQFDVEQANAIATFNSELQQQRDLFNAQNSLVVEQANAQWRQNIATLNNAAQNEANMALAQTLNALSMSNVEQIWQRERDLMSYSIQTANNNADRATQIALQKLANEASASTAAANKSAAFASAAGSIVSSIIFG